MKNRIPILVALAAAAALVSPPRLLGCEGKAAAPKPPDAASQATAASAAAARPAGGAGLLAFVDPVTGKLYEPPAAEVEEMLRSESFRSAVSTSHDGLYEVKRPTGGYGLPLQGRFRSAVVATVGPDGKIRMGHPAAPPGPAPQKDGGKP